MSKTLNPNILTLCIMLAGEDHRSGVLLDRVVWWNKYSSAHIPKKPGTWIANDHQFWKRDTRLSRDQLTRSLKYLDQRHLIERTQFWWGGCNILHVRPTQKTLNFLGAAKTWPAADELMAELKNHPTELSGSAKPSSAYPLKINGWSKSAQLDSAELQNSNYIKSIHKNEQKKLTSGSSAKLTYPELSQSQIEIEIPEVQSSEVSLASATGSWISSAKTHFPDGEVIELSANQKGAVALIAQDLGDFFTANGTISFQPNTPDILEFGIRHWGKWETKALYPNPEDFYHRLENIVNCWVKAGSPTIKISI